MRTYRSKAGPFSEQPFYEPAEVETICVDELRKVSLYPSEPSPIRIDRFIEKRFQIQPSYEDLPEGLLGFTRFSAAGVQEIVVAKAFDEDGSRPAERRLRTTLAHESGHGLLHAHLFALSIRPASLFGDGLASDAPKILCREDGVSGIGEAPNKRAPYRWWEYQANLAMGALLLPKTLVDQALSPFLVREGTIGIPMLPGDRRDRALYAVAEVFDVNPVVARIRLDGLYPAGADRQLTL